MVGEPPIHQFAKYNFINMWSLAYLRPPNRMEIANLKPAHRPIAIWPAFLLVFKSLQELTSFVPSINLPSPSPPSLTSFGQVPRGRAACCPMRRASLRGVLAGDCHWSKIRPRKLDFHTKLGWQIGHFGSSQPLLR